MSKKLYKLYCEICNWKKITDGTDVAGMFEMKQSPVPTTIPKQDPITKKTIESKTKKRPHKFRCPNCGRAITPKKLSGVKKDDKNGYSREEGSS
ncbi:unnamed protein product [marine sediment metagenome]|uniref:Uncharacterized protein n=1 Tax=marine sediment metagenome TaxID=412755 RepID=X0TUJ7_9ZZZZ